MCNGPLSRNGHQVDLRTIRGLVVSKMAERLHCSPSAGRARVRPASSMRGSLYRPLAGQSRQSLRRLHDHAVANERREYLRLALCRACLRAARRRAQVQCERHRAERGRRRHEERSDISRRSPSLPGYGSARHSHHPRSDLTNRRRICREQCHPPDDPPFYIKGGPRVAGSLL